jgi:hypothetical protein
LLFLSLAKPFISVLLLQPEQMYLIELESSSKAQLQSEGPPTSAAYTPIRPRARLIMRRPATPAGISAKPPTAARPATGVRPPNWPPPPCPLHGAAQPLPTPVEDTSAHQGGPAFAPATQKSFTSPQRCRMWNEGGMLMVRAPSLVGHDEGPSLSLSFAVLDPR